MKKLVILLTLLPCIIQAQVGHEDFYSEKDLQSYLQKAKTPARQLDAFGSLSVYHKKIYKDSIANSYLKNVFYIAGKSKEPQLMARALWWDAYFESCIYGNVNYELSREKANKSLLYAERNNLTREIILANLLLIDITIHDNLPLAQQFCLTAERLLADWKKDTIDKDSVSVETYGRLAHTYIHLKDGIKTTIFLQILQDYTLTAKNESLKIIAADLLAEMYFEWYGHEKKAFPWYEKLYDYFKKTNQPQNLLRITSKLAMLHRNVENYEEAKKYLNETERLHDSLEMSSYYQFYWLNIKLTIGLITTEQYIQTLDNNFNNRLFLPSKMIATQKAHVYLTSNRLDSGIHYLSIAENLGEENKEVWLAYYYMVKDYKRLIPLSKELISDYEKRGDLDWAQLNSRNLSDIFKERKEYEPALEYLNKAWLLKDSLNELLNKDKVAEMEMQRQMDLQKAAFNEETRLRESEKEKMAFKNKIRFFGLSGGIAILVLLAGILWRNNERKQKDKLQIEQAYQELKTTQSQLIQSAKMASLGELTAGIAHEIQNPLNFVNNFSEVSVELMQEMKDEIAKGNTDEVIHIATDIEQNLEKINHHGKRADAIVKGMLQHSQTSTGKKEPTDINKLADEYLRLSYHGILAKNKSFNATLKTDFDETIGNINIIQQDIGRVLLNLYNNAFYAVNEKKKQQPENYEPTVSIITKKLDGKIEVSVKDNGNGMPQKIVDKIFQPFFTTKPTGQGTGLGLSLAYDIVKAHDGEIKVESKEGKGTEFIIYLPINNA